jgi:hypothetical protein
MSAESATFSLDEPKAYRPILWGGLIVGILDISAACINSALQSGRSPMWVLQSVASGLLGADSYKGGLRSAALGAAVHFTIATTVCTVYYLASRKLKFLVQHAIASGLLYGVAVYLFMYFVVIPITFHRGPSYPFRAIVTALGIHMVCVGLPAALVIRRFSKEAEIV